MKRFIVSALLALALLALPFMAWAGAAKSDYNWQKTGHLMFYDGSTYETLFGSFPVSGGFEFSELSATSNSTTFTGTLWSSTQIGQAPLTARLAADPGYWELDTGTSSGARSAMLTQGDEARLYTDKGLIFETRVRVPSLTTDVNGTGIWAGVGGAWAGGSVTSSAFVGVTHNATDGWKFRNWNSTDQLNSTIASGPAANTWFIVRLDFTDLDNVRGFINGVEITDGAQSWSYSSDLQPTYSANATTTGSSAKLDIDYMRFFQNRE